MRRLSITTLKVLITHFIQNRSVCIKIHQIPMCIKACIVKHAERFKILVGEVLWREKKCPELSNFREKKLEKNSFKLRGHTIKMLSSVIFTTALNLQSSIELPITPIIPINIKIIQNITMIENLVCWKNKKVFACFESHSSPRIMPLWVFWLCSLTWYRIIQLNVGFEWKIASILLHMTKCRK